MRVVELQPFENSRQHTVAFDKRFAVREAQDVKTKTAQLRGSALVRAHRFRLEVLAAIELNDQHRFDASEVCEIPTDGALTSKLVAVELSIPQRTPQGLLGLR